jgi:hypothetical protein
MLSLILRSYLKLLSFDFYLTRGNFRALYDRVRNHPRRQNTQTPCSVAEICQAVDTACIWYPKPVLCLQRSAATACLLKDHGVRAEMIIGAQQIPFRAHAWVEVDRYVVNDKPYVREMYQVLDRC